MKHHGFYFKADGFKRLKQLEEVTGRDRKLPPHLFNIFTVLDHLYFVEDGGLYGVVLYCELCKWK